MNQTINDKEYEFDVVVNYMDDEIREELHSEMAPCTEQQFTDAYIKAHKDKFNEDFIIN